MQENTLLKYYKNKLINVYTSLYGQLFSMRKKKDDLYLGIQNFIIIKS